MSGGELATGYVSITASAEGVGRAIVAQFQQAEQGAAKAGESSGKKFSGAFGKLAGLATGAALAGMVKGAADAEQATRKLTAQLALTADESKRFGEDAKALFSNNFAGSVDEANDAIKSVVTNIGGLRSASDKDLTAITGKVSSLASTFGVDLNDVTIAVGQQIKTGLAANASDALDNIAAGFQHGDDKAGDFLDTLNEYGVQFQKLGINGTTATGLLSQGLQAGARDADLVADALKEFSIRAVDGSTTTAAGFTALGLNVQATSEAIAHGGQAASSATEEVLTKMRAIEDPVKRAAVATELFGTQSEDLGKALFALDLDTAAKGLGDVAGAAQNVSDTVGGGANASITTFWQTLQTTGITIGQDLLPNLEPALGLLQDVGAVAGGAAEFFNGLPGPIKDAALAFGAMVLLRGPLVSFFGQIQARAAAAAVSLAASNGIAGAAGAAAGGLSRFAGVLGGPWGLAIGVGVTALASFIGSNKDSEKAVEDNRAAVAALGDTLDKTTGQLTTASAVKIGQDWIASGVADQFKNVEGGAAMAAASIVQGGSAVDDFRSKILAAAGPIDKWNDKIGDDNLNGLTVNAAAAGVSVTDLANIVSDGGEGFDSLAKRIATANKTVEGASTNVDDIKASLSGAVGSLNDLTPAFASYNTEVAAGSQAAQIATDSIKLQGDATKALTGAISDGSGGFSEYISGLQAIGSAHDGAAYAARVGKVDFSDFALTVDRGSQAAGAGAGSLSAVSDEFVRMTPSAVAAAASQGSWNLVMQQAKGVADEESQSLATLSLAIDTLSGRHRTAEEATKALNDQVRAIKTAFDDGTKATNGNIESLITASGAIDTTSEAGSKLYDSLNNYRTAADQSTDAAYESAVAAGNQAGALGLARKAADDARDRFLAQADALGINKAAAEKMADQLGILEGQKLTDKDFDINAKDNASGPIGDVKAGIDGLGDKTVNLKVLISGAADAASSAVSSLTNLLFKAKGGMIRGRGTGTSDSILMAASNGEGVNTAAAMRHPENQAAMHFMNAGGVIPGFANGGLINVNMAASGNAQGAFGALSNFYSKVDQAVGSANSQAAAAAKAATAIPKANSGGTEQWRALATRVASAHHEDLASVQVMLNQMSRESSGNPAAINLTDSNAQAGHPSVGLLQFIPSTFAAYADPGYSSNIYDPESQMRAWYNYINAQYGGYVKFGQRGYGAYATGDLIHGMGNGTSDSNLIRVSNGEGINTQQAMSHSENVAAMRFMNAGGIIPGFADGGLVSSRTLSGIPSGQYGTRRSTVEQGVAAIGDALAAQADRLAARQRAADDAADVLERTKQQRRDAKSKGEIAAADAAVAYATKAKKLTDDALAAESKRSTVANSTQRALSGVYHSLETSASRFDVLTGRIDAARTALAGAQSTLAGTRQNKAQAVSGYATSIAGFDGGLTGHSDLRTTSAQVVAGRKYDLGKITSFYKDLATLRKRGASVGILDELTGKFGSGGEITAHALATGPLGDLKATEAFEQQINKVAGQAGSIAPSLQYDAQIRAQAAQVKAQQTQVNALVRQQQITAQQLETLAPRITAAMRAGLAGASFKLDGKGILTLITPHVDAHVAKAKAQSR